MERVLIVDDERGVRDSLQAILADEGLEADAVASGEQALDLVGRRDYGAVLLDVWLPRADGLEVLRAIGIGPGRPVVILISGHGSIETAVRATRMGAFDFLEKPLSLEKVVLVVRNALRQRRLEDQNRNLRRETLGEPRIVGEGEAAARLRREVSAIAVGRGGVLIRGEGGAGKELVARAIHAGSGRAEEAFVAVYCAGIPADRFEAELFGAEDEPGAEGAGRRRGRLALAQGGTLFLDDVEELPAAQQGRLAGALGAGSSHPVGSPSPHRIDVRVIGATRGGLDAGIQAGAFLPALAEQLRGSTVTVPPLRDRLEDVPGLAMHFLQEFRAHYGAGPRAIDPAALTALREYRWPGNVRELRNLVERLVIVAPTELVRREDLPEALGGAAPKDDPFAPERTLRQGREMFERQFILRRLEEHDYNVTRTAQALGLERSHLHRKIKALGLD